MVGIVNPYRFGGPPSTLLDSLISWWEMDEVSGARVDVHGGLTLAQDTTVGSDTGHVHALAADFNAVENDMLDRASSPYAGTIGTIALWAKANALVSNDWLFNIGTTTPGATDMELFVTSTGSTFQFRVDNDTTPAGRSGQTSTNWNLFICDWTTTVGRLFVNTVKGTDSSGSYAGIRGLGGHTVRVGNRFTGNSQGWDGQIGPMSIWIGRRLTIDEHVELYNGGAGIAYPG